MNQILVSLSGRLGKDPELRYAQSGDLAICNFSVAVNHRQKNKATGQWETKATTWLDCVAFGKVAEGAAAELSKGCNAMVVGRLETRTWEKDGEKKSKIQVIVEAVGRQVLRDQRVPTGAQTSMATDGGGQDQGDDAPVGDDDIPF